MNAKLSEHFQLGELCKTSHKTADGNIPSRVVIENLRRICEDWLEDLRYSNNVLYKEVGSDGGQVPVSPEAQSVSDRNLSPVRHDTSLEIALHKVLAIDDAPKGLYRIRHGETQVIELHEDDQTPLLTYIGGMVGTDGTCLCQTLPPLCLALHTQRPGLFKEAGLLGGQE